MPKYYNFTISFMKAQLEFITISSSISRIIEATKFTISIEFTIYNFI